MGRARMRRRVMLVVALWVVSALVGTSAAFAGSGQSDWAEAEKIDEINGNDPELNTPALEGCPIQSPNGLSLYMASNRPGNGGLDIWVATRPNKKAPWGPPVNLGEPVNSAADDFCPTPVNGGLFFVSREALPGACGLGDIYFARGSLKKGFSEPQRLACAPEGPNSALDEQGPSYVKGRLYFSRSSATVPGDIFVSRMKAKMRFGPAVAVVELNDVAGNDIQPNVRNDGREVVFSSNRTGSMGQDIWVATRRSVAHPWSTPVNLGPAVNTTASESRPSLSWGGKQLLFGRSPGPEGSSDIYVTTRTKK